MAARAAHGIGRRGTLNQVEAETIDSRVVKTVRQNILDVLKTQVLLQPELCRLEQYQRG
jgi:hypothetical protein